MNWFNDDRDIWKEIIETVAAEEHRTTQMIEKDTVQSMFLLELSKNSLPLAFKGGTSLSKAYDLIYRFSEDIDLSAARKLTESEKSQAKNAVIGAAENTGLVLTNPEAVQSGYSYNKYVFTYDSLFSVPSPEMVVETSFYQAVYPVLTHRVLSFVGRFCERRGIELPVPFEASSVNMQIQSPERTFIDKVFAVCDYRLQDKQNRNSRHLYDIAKLLPLIEINDDLISLICEVRKDRMQSRNNPSAQPEHSISELLREIISSRFYEADYNNITKRLLYEDVSYDEAINDGIARVAEMGIFEYIEQI